MQLVRAASPYAAFEYGSQDVIRPDREGMVRVSGVRDWAFADWPALERATLLRFSVAMGE